MNNYEHSDLVRSRLFEMLHHLLEKPPESSLNRLRPRHLLSSQWDLRIEGLRCVDSCRHSVPVLIILACPFWILRFHLSLREKNLQSITHLQTNNQSVLIKIFENLNSNLGHFIDWFQILSLYSTKYNFALITVMKLGFSSIIIIEFIKLGMRNDARSICISILEKRT